MKKTLFVMFSIVLMLIAFSSCDGEPTTIPEEQLEANKLASDYISAIRFADVLDKALSNDDETISASPAVNTVAVAFKDYTGDAVKKGGDIEGIVSGELTYEFTDSSAKTLAGHYGIKTTKPLVFKLTEGSVAENTVTFEISGSCNVDIIKSENGSIAGIGAGSSFGEVESAVITVGEGESAISVDFGDVDITIDNTIDSDDVDDRKPISSESELIEAAASGEGEYYLTKDMNLASQLDITAAIILDGNGKVINFTAQSNVDASEASAILVKGIDGVVLKNLTVKGQSEYKPRESWVNGEYGIKVWNSSDVVLENINISGMNAGMQIISADASIKGNITVNGNNWGGIGVSKDSGMEKAGALTIEAGTTVICTDEYSPSIWTESNGNVIDNTKSLIHFESDDQSQTWYITEDQEGKKSDLRCYIDDEDEFKNAIKKSGTYYITDEITVSGQVDVTASDITLEGIGDDAVICLSDGATAGADQAAFEVYGDGVKIRNLKITADYAGKETEKENYSYILTAYGQNLFLDGVDFVLAENAVIAGPNFYGKEGKQTSAELSNVKITGKSGKAPLNMSNADVTIESIDLSAASGLFGTSHKQNMDYDIQINGNIDVSTLTINNAESIDSIWAEDIGSGEETQNISISGSEIKEVAIDAEFSAIKAFIDAGSTSDFAKIKILDEKSVSGTLYARASYLGKYFSE